MLAIHVEIPWGIFQIKKRYLDTFVSSCNPVYIISKLNYSLNCDITWLQQQQVAYKL